MNKFQAARRSYGQKFVPLRSVTLRPTLSAAGAGHQPAAGQRCEVCHYLNKMKLLRCVFPKNDFVLLLNYSEFIRKITTYQVGLSLPSENIA
jgi:hypothetical protein